MHPECAVVCAAELFNTFAYTNQTHANACGNSGAFKTVSCNAAHTLTKTVVGSIQCVISETCFRVRCACIIFQACHTAHCAHKETFVFRRISHKTLNAVKFVAHEARVFKPDSTSSVALEVHTRNWFFTDLALEAEDLIMNSVSQAICACKIRQADITCAAMKRDGSTGVRQIDGRAVQ